MNTSLSPALSVEGLTFAYPSGRTVFNDFSFNAGQGEFVVLLGPSGCGKSTLLNLLSGFSKPDRGSLSVLGIRAEPECEDLGYVFQQPHLFGWLTALDNVAFGLKMLGRGDKKQRSELAFEYLSKVGLAHASSLLPHQMSGGMQQRVSLARALALQPRVLLMDEPFAALDAITRAAMNELTQSLWSELGQTTVFITHDIEEAVFLADRVIVLNLAPGGIHSELEIALSRPRNNQQTRSQPEFQHYRHQLLQRINSVMQHSLPTRGIQK